ncbi:MAG: radical SAM protein [Promethearchaeia archaeon]
MAVNILFLIPDFFYIEDYQKYLYYNDIPLGTLQISAFLKKRLNANTNIIDLRIENEKHSTLNHKIPDLVEYKKEFIHILETYNISEYNYIGISCYTSFQYLFSKYIAEILKEQFPNKIIFTGGYHPTAIPHDFTYEKSPFDFIIKGEGEGVLLNLLQRNKNRNIKANKGRSCVLSADKLIDINKLPIPDYSQYLNNYPFKNRFNFEIYTSRGCPYQCAFCAKNFKFRSFNFDSFKHRFENLCNIVQEYNPKNPKIIFADQLFNKVKIKKELIEYIEKNELHEEFIFSCQSRVETAAKNNNLKRLRKNNFIIGFGFESADYNLLKEMHKTKYPPRYVKNMKKILKIYNENPGTYCRVNILAGFPGENSVTFDNTINFLQENIKSNKIQIGPTLFSNYPNVFVYHHMKQFEKKFGTIFIKEWWKRKMNQLKVSVPNKPSKNYSLNSLIFDYKEKYFPLLKNFFNYKNIFGLAMWKKYHDDWYNVLLRDTSKKIGK